jgi:Flp pilus assembly protein TadD
MADDMASELDDLWHEADTRIEHGHFDKAVEIYKYILIRYSDNSIASERAHAHLGETLLMLGQSDLAERHIRKALSYDPENPRYHSLLGFIYYTQYQWKNASHEYELALDREPWNRDYLRALANATFCSGDRKRGLEYLHEAAVFYPDNSGMLVELATAYLSIGDIASAKRYADEAVQVNPSDIMAHAVLRRIRQKVLTDLETKEGKNAQDDVQDSQRTRMP